jgi:hypothetical protein
LSRSEILRELPKLTPEKWQVVCLRLAGLAQDEWLEDGALTDVEGAISEQRFRDLEANPHAAVSWEEAKLRLMAPFKRWDGGVRTPLSVQPGSLGLEHRLVLDQGLVKGGCRRLHGFRSTLVAGPSRFGGLPLLNRQNLAHPRVSVVTLARCRDTPLALCAAWAEDDKLSDDRMRLE